MRYVAFPTKCLVLCAFALAASGCGERVISTPLFPASVDLMVEQKPVPGPEIVESEQAAAEYDAAIEAWGERGWRQIGRICRYAQGHGMKINCPEAPEAEQD